MPYPIRAHRRAATALRVSLLLLSFATVAAQSGSDSRPPAAGGRALSATLGADYQLAARDLVQFQVYEEPDVQAVQRVSASGEITVPMLGTVRVAGMTLREAERHLEQAYIQNGYFVKPQVMLSVQTYAPRTVSVLGQVNKPEQIEFPVERERIGIVQAITLAGGFTRVAKTDGVKVLRIVGGQERQFTVNVADYLQATGKPEFTLQAEDVVFVPERVF